MQELGEPRAHRNKMGSDQPENFAENKGPFPKEMEACEPAGGSTGSPRGDTDQSSCLQPPGGAANSHGSRGAQGMSRGMSQALSGQQHSQEMAEAGARDSAPSEHPDNKNNSQHHCFTSKALCEQRLSHSAL